MRLVPSLRLFAKRKPIKRAEVPPEPGPSPHKPILSILGILNERRVRNPRVVYRTLARLSRRTRDPLALGLLLLPDGPATDEAFNAVFQLDRLSKTLAVEHDDLYWAIPKVGRWPLHIQRSRRIECLLTEIPPRYVTLRLRYFSLSAAPTPGVRGRRRRLLIARLLAAIAREQAAGGGALRVVVGSEWSITPGLLASLAGPDPFARLVFLSPTWARNGAGRRPRRYLASSGVWKAKQGTP